MTAAEKRERMRVLGAEGDDVLLDLLLEQAASFILAFTWRDRLPEALSPLQIRLSMILYNRMGMEGESEHTEGDVRRAAAFLPDDLRRELTAYRLARSRAY